MKKKNIIKILVVIVVLIIIGLIIENLFPGDIIYKITYSNLVPGNSSKYEIDIYSNYNASINEIRTGSFAGAIPVTSTYRKHLSLIDKIYLKYILDNIDKFADEGIGKSFIIYDVNSQKKYYIEIGTKEGEKLECILTFNN